MATLQLEGQRLGLRKCPVAKNAPQIRTLADSYAPRYSGLPVYTKFVLGDEEFAVSSEILRRMPFLRSAAEFAARNKQADHAGRIVLYSHGNCAVYLNAILAYLSSDYKLRCLFEALPEQAVPVDLLAWMDFYGVELWLPSAEEAKAFKRLPNDCKAEEAIEFVCMLHRGLFTPSLGKAMRPTVFNGLQRLFASKTSQIIPKSMRPHLFSIAYGKRQLFTPKQQKHLDNWKQLNAVD